METARLEVAEVEALAAIPGLAHGFERRGDSSRDENRDATRARATRRLQATGRLFLMRQVHGACVVEAPWEERPEADAAIATGQGLVLGVETADCLPILLVDPMRRAVGAVHAGWRGTASEVAMRAVESLRAQGSRSEDLVAALGPAIGPCCYEVGDELRPAFDRWGGDLFRPGPRGRPHLDVRAANRRQLLSAGLRDERIHDVAQCTSCRRDLYHSYRRDGPNGGRMISFVGFRVS